MITYQLAFFCIMAVLILSVLLIGLIETVVKKHKAKKQVIAELEKENKRLQDKLYSIKFQAELRGLNLNI